eukprot:2560212-Prymnesium_polylepis.1
MGAWGHAHGGMGAWTWGHGGMDLGAWAWGVGRSAAAQLECRRGSHPTVSAPRTRRVLGAIAAIIAIAVGDPIWAAWASVGATEGG